MMKIFMVADKYCLFICGNDVGVISFTQLFDENLIAEVITYMHIKYFHVAKIW